MPGTEELGLPLGTGARAGLTAPGHGAAVSATKRFARIVGWAGLTAAGALHAVWASGSPWPAKDVEQLGEAVVGNAEAMPDARATWVVAAAAVCGGAIAAGGLGEGRVAVGLRRLIGLGMCVRAALGGGPALKVLGLPPAGEEFRELDRRYYRPLFGVIGWAIFASAKK